MENNTKCIESLKSKLKTIKASNAMLKTLSQQANNNINEAKTYKSTAMELNERLLKQLQEHIAVIEEGHILKFELDALDTHSNTGQVVANMRNILYNLGCTLVTNHDKDNRPLYKFDFNKNGFIIVTYTDSRLKLLEIFPARQNFAEIKQYAEDSQDLMGLLVNYTEFTTPADNPFILKK